MALRLLSCYGTSGPAPIERGPNRAVRRRDRVVRRFVRAVRSGLSMPDSVPARQARLLADIFGSQLGPLLENARHAPLTLHVVSHNDVRGTVEQHGTAAHGASR